MRDETIESFKVKYSEIYIKHFLQKRYSYIASYHPKCYEKSKELLHHWSATGHNTASSASVASFPNLNISAISS